jgi:hypothetical protein
MDWIDEQLALENRTIAWLNKVDGLSHIWEGVYRDSIGLRDQTPYLKDVANPLTVSEMLAIWFQTGEKYRELQRDVRSGRAGVWNCFYDYLESGLRKLKGAPNGTILYTGIRPADGIAWGLTSESGEVLVKPGDVIIATSQGSSTPDFDRARHYATNGPSNLRALMLWASGPLSAVDITSFSTEVRDLEHLCLPGTRLLVHSLENTDIEDPWHELFNITFINVTELEPAPTIWEEGPEWGSSAILQTRSSTVEMSSAGGGHTQTWSLAPTVELGSASVSLSRTVELGSVDGVPTAGQSWWQNSARAKVFMGIAIGVTVIALVLGVWMCCIKRWCRPPCTGESDQLLQPSDPLLTYQSGM